MDLKKRRDGKMTKQKENLGLAGEYFITSELLLRDFYVQPTFGKMKKMDLLMVDLKDEESKTKIIEVKTSQTRKRFPMVKGIPLKDNYYIIFLDYEDKRPIEKPDVYILNAVDWFELIERLITDEVDGWRTKTPRDKRKGKPKEPDDRTIWVYNHPNCVIRKIKGNEEIKYIVEDRASKTSNEIAVIEESEGKVNWKNPKGALGIDVPIGTLKQYKVEYDEEWKSIRK